MRTRSGYWLSDPAWPTAAGAAGHAAVPLGELHHANGLPDNNVFNVKVDGERVWAANRKRTGAVPERQVEGLRHADGLAHRAVLYVDVDTDTDDVWVATMGGAEPASRRDASTTLPSSTAACPTMSFTASRCKATRSGSPPPRAAAAWTSKPAQWTHFNERNTPMYEIWTYAVSPGADKVYYAVWGGGVLEYDVKTERWKDYNDPDGETEMVVLKDQGLIHEITTSVS